MLRTAQKQPKKVQKVAKKSLKKAPLRKTIKRSMAGCPFGFSSTNTNKAPDAAAATTKKVPPPGNMTEEEVAIVKSCVPILETGGVALTTHFYKNMIGEEDIVKPFFNKAHQHHLSQPKALAFSVLAYAKNIDDLGAMLADKGAQKLIATIVKKHVALQIKPEHYPIVGKHLLRAIREVLGADVATDKVLTAWGKAYGILADLLIGLEDAEYKALAAVPGGWEGGRQFKIISKEVANKEGTAINYLIQSEDKQPVMKPLGGQYLTLRLKDPKFDIDTTRSYSVSDIVRHDDKGVGNIYRFSTQVVENGVVSNYLLKHKNVGDNLTVFPITGEFTLRDINVEGITNNSEPTTFIAAGSGITPFISMIHHYRDAFPTRKLNLLHAVTNADKEFFAKEKAELQKKYNVNVTTLYSDVNKIVDNDVPTPHYKDHLKEILATTPAQNIYVVGPEGFMKTTHNIMTKDLGLDGSKVNYEFFGPHQFF